MVRDPLLELHPCSSKEYAVKNRVSDPCCADDLCVRTPTNSKPALAAGPIRRWVVGRPRLAAGPELSPQSRYTVGYRVGVAARAFLVISLITAVVAAACWALLMTTVLASVSIDGKTIVTQRATWVEGQAPQGVTATVLPSAVQRDIASRIDMLLGNEHSASVVTIIGGPNARAATDLNGHILIGGVPTGYVSTTPIPAHNLGTAYLAVCVMGPCGTPGTPLEVPVSHVLGKTLGSPTFLGWAPVTAGDTAGSHS
jgi:hypothetical protein